MAYIDKAFGVHSSTASCFVSTSSALVVGVGTHIRVLDPVSVQANRSFQGGLEPLVSIRALRDSGRVLVVTVTGEIAIIDLVEGVVAVERREREVHYAAVCEKGDFAVLCTENCLEMLEIASNRITPVYEINGKYQISEITPSKDLFSLSSPSISPSNSPYTACLHSKLGLITHISLTFTTAVLTTCKTSGNLAVLLFTDRQIAVIAMDSLNILKIMSVKGVGTMGTVGFEGNKLYFIPERGIFTVISINEEKLDEKIDPFAEEQPAGVVSVKTSQDLLSKEACFLHWTEPYLFLCSHNGVYRFEFTNFPMNNRLSYSSWTLHQAGCTAVSLSSTGTSLCSGDDMGQVLVWDLATSQLIATFQTFLPISDLHWSPSEEQYILVGTKVGSVFLISQPFAQEADVSEVVSFPMSTLLLASGQGKLAVAATYGEVRVYDVDEVGSLEQIAAFLYCGENKGDLKRRNMRMLTAVCWGPLLQIAVGSEDHFVTIWRLSLNTFHKEATLTHSSAPISDLCWHICALPLAELLIACSRDGQLRIYSPDHWSLLLVFTSTSDPFLRVALDPARNLLSVCSHSGLLSLFDLVARRRTTQRHILSSGTSRLSWQAQWLAAVSGFNSVQVLAA